MIDTWMNQWEDGWILAIWGVGMYIPINILCPFHLQELSCSKSLKPWWDMEDGAYRVVVSNPLHKIIKTLTVDGRPLHWSPKASRAKYHKLNGLKTRNLLFHNYGSLRSSCQQDWFHLRSMRENMFLPLSSAGSLWHLLAIDALPTSLP